MTGNKISCISLLLLTLSYVAPAAVVASDDIADDPRKYFKKLLEERAAIRFLHVEWSVTILKDVKFSQLEQCRYDFEGWYDFETGACRVDGHTACPNNQQINGSPRFSFNGQVYRVIYRDNVMGYELHGFDRHYLNEVGAFTYELSTDMRLLGIFPAPFWLLKNFSLDDLSRYVNGPKDLTVASVNGKRVLEVRGFFTPEITAFLEIDQDSHLPSRIETREANSASGGQRFEMHCVWKKHLHHNGETDLWFPRTVTTRTWNDGVTLSNEDSVEVTAVDIGQPTPENLYEWKSLAPADGFVVEFRQDTKRFKVEEWDADDSKFVTWTPTPLETQPTSDIDAPEVGTTRWWLIAVNVLVIVGIVVWLIVSRRQ